jgi:hypothetical protein
VRYIPGRTLIINYDGEIFPQSERADDGDQFERRKGDLCFFLGRAGSDLGRGACIGNGGVLAPGERVVVIYRIEVI